MFNSKNVENVEKYKISDQSQNLKDIFLLYINIFL